MLGTEPTTQAITFGAILRRLRKHVGLSQEQLALEADLQRNYISLMELGRYQPTITTLFKVAQALKVSPSSIILELEGELAQKLRQATRSKKA